jgi:hypothetical protein
MLQLTALECREALAKKAIGCARSATIALVQILAPLRHTNAKQATKKKKKVNTRLPRRQAPSVPSTASWERKQGSKNNKTEHDATILQ